MLTTCMCCRCLALADIKDNEEKDSAFRGMCAAIQLNPNAMASVSALNRYYPILREEADVIYQIPSVIRSFLECDCSLVKTYTSAE